MSSDDGEPPHSAGDPILGQIKSKSLTNVLVIVVRYFGGTKLGVSGLIHAYKTSALDALNNAQVIEAFICSSVLINYSYEETSQVMKIMNDYELTIEKQEFLATCTLVAAVRESKKESLEATLTSLQIDYRWV